MNIHTLTESEAVTYLQALRRTLDRLINNDSIDIILRSKLIDARNWFGEMLNVLGRKGPDKWTAAYPQFKNDLESHESINLEIREMYADCQKAVFAIQLKEPEKQMTFQAGYTKAIYYLMEAAMLAENEIEEITTRGN